MVSLSAIAYAESVRVAGDELNETIQRFIQDEFQILIGENLAEEIKIALGSAMPLPEPLTMEVAGKSLIDGTPTNVMVTDAQVRECIREPVNIIVNAVMKALEKTPPELVTDIARNGLLLAGGGALLKGLDTRISQETNLSVLLDDDPLTTVVRGTGRSMEDRVRYRDVFIN